MLIPTHKKMDFRSIFSRKNEWDWGLVFSYNLSRIDFFELEILPNLNIRNNLTLVIDEANYYSLTGSKDFIPHYFGVYYNLEKVALRYGGVFHAKLFLFLNDEKLHLSIGSPNLTSTGFKANLESLIQLQFEIGNLDKDSIMVINQLRDILEKSFLHKNFLFNKISQSLQNQIREIIYSKFFRNVKDMEQNGVAKEGNCYLLSSLEQGLFSQVKNILGNKTNKIEALSPYFDKSADCLEFLRKSSDSVDLYIPRKNNSFPWDVLNGSISSIKKIKYFFIEKEDNKIDRFIHSKFYRFHSKQNVLDLITSGNCTRAGMFNDSYPRNFELAFLFPSNNENFINAEDIHIEPIKDIDIQEQQMDEIEPSPVEIKKSLIESAYYVENRITISFQEEFYKNYSIENFYIELFLYSDRLEKLSICNTDNSNYVEPSMEIEGDKLIKIRLNSDVNDDFHNPFVYVCRKKHDLNYLPVLGASAFNKCVRIGGLEGVGEAFRIARNSGKKDWLLFLLSHWNLERILSSIGPKKKIEPQMEESDEDDISPSLRKPGEKKRARRLQSNLNCLAGHIDLLRNLEKFVTGLDEKCYNVNDKMKNYINFCFPLFLEMGKHYSKILKREENRKEINPTIKYPRYTWLQNFHECQFFMSFIFERIIEILRPSEILREKDKGSYYHFLSLALLWIRFHTKKTQSEFFRNNSDYYQIEDEITKRIKSISLKVEDKVRIQVMQTYEDYGISAICL